LWWCFQDRVADTNACSRFTKALHGKRFEMALLVFFLSAYLLGHSFYLSTVFQQLVWIQGTSANRMNPTLICDIVA
jgi:hypothetical protein